MGSTTDTDPRVVAARTPEEETRVVESLGRAGVDLVKVYAWLTSSTYRAVADRARGLCMVGQLPLEVDSEGAIAAGQRSIEHDGNAEGGTHQAATCCLTSNATCTLQ